MSNKMLPSGISVRVREDLIDGVSRTQTTIIVDPLVTLSGHRITMADIGTIGYGKIDQGKASEEIISWTGITDNVTTYTLTGCTWGVNFHNLENATANIKRHVSGAQFAIMTDMHYIAGEFRDNADNVFTNTDPMEFQGNEILLGDGTSDNDKVIKADNGDANEPFMAYDEGLGKWVISNDGVNSYDPEQGGSGVTAGDGIDITGGEVSVDVDELVDDEMLEVTGNRLGTVINEDTGLFKDANGLNIDVIDPDNPVAQSPARLEGGTDVVLQNFIDLGAGDNDGAFKANIDGVDYDDVEINSRQESGSEALEINAFSSDTKISSSSITSIAQSITNNKNFKTITKIRIYTYDITSESQFTLTLKTGHVYGAGDTLGVGANNISTNSNTGVDGVEYTDVLFASPIDVNDIEEMHFVITRTAVNGTNGLYRSNTSVYSGGQMIEPNNANYDIAFKAYGTTWVELDSLDNVAVALQTAIRNATSSTETVVWDTNHFEITSTISGKNKGSQVLKLQPPTTGTDISGAGYLDLGANATEVAGDGDDYKLVRLDDEGLLPSEVLDGVDGSQLTASFNVARAIASDTLRASADTERSKGGTDSPTNTPTKYKEISTEFGGIIRVKFDGRGNNNTGQEYAQVYKNGVPVGTLRDVSSSTYTTFSEDLLFEKGDLIQLYIWTTFNYSSYRAYGKNFRVYYDLENGDIANVNLD